MDEMKNKELYENIYKQKFSFGRNWSNFLKKLNKKRIENSKINLRKFTGLTHFKDKTFLDIGCGSGIHSLSAYFLGANVISTDIDEFCINCVKFLRKKVNASPKRWQVLQGSALDKNFLNKIGKVDIVYSWGVLHHTGNMWHALENITGNVKKGGLMYIAIYNDFKGFPSSKTWLKIKKIYANSPKFLCGLMNLLLALQILTMQVVRFKNPLKFVREYSAQRGMNFYNDVIDWLGGYPYEFASVAQIKSFYEKKRFMLKNLRRNKGTGNNEFLFAK